MTEAVEEIPVRGIRADVLNFARQMERVMRRNEREKGKGDSWRTCPIEHLEGKQVEEFRESTEPLHDPEEHVDLAIVSMFLYLRERQFQDAYGPPDLKGGD